MRCHPARLRRPTGIAVCNLGEVLPSRWFLEGLVVVGYNERTQVSRLGRRGRWEGCEEMEEGLV